MEPCDDEHIIEVVAAKDPLIVNLADGEHYLSLTFAVCITSKMTKEQFTPKIPLVLHVANELLSTYTKDDFFKGAAAAKPKSTTTEGELDLGGMDEQDTSFVGEKDRVRGELVRAYAERDMDYIKDVYFTSFLVQ